MIALSASDFANATPVSLTRPVGTILAIDDSRDTLVVVGRQLAQVGYRVVLSDNGSDALDLIAARGFDLVLLDTTLPRRSGVQIVRDIRNTRATADLPIIMLTGPDDPIAAVEALAAGADDHLAKPFDFEILAARIARVLARARCVTELKRSNAALDARIALRAIELGEANSALAATRADRQRLTASLAALNDHVERLSQTTASR